MRACCDFVYVMAALTGIVAIVLYAGGWLREGPTKRAPEEAVASASQSAQPEITAKTVAPPAAIEKPCGKRLTRDTAGAAGHRAERDRGQAGRARDRGHDGRAAEAAGGERHAGAG